MKKLFFMAVAAIAALSSCTSDNELELNQNTGKEALTFTATMEDSEATRATYDSENKYALWEAGDQISINGKSYTAQEGAGATATFKADGEGAEGTTYEAYFPADLIDGTTATLPAIQTYEADKFNMPMYATSTTTTLQFYNLCAVLAIKVTSADIATLKSIKVASDQKMNGTFTVTDKKAVMGTDGTNAVVLESATALTLDETGTTFYIAIPAQEYKYLNIFLSADGETYTQAMATKKAVGLGAIARSTIFNIDYAKNATKMWKGNVLVADCNVGATSPEAYGGLYSWGGNKDKEEQCANTEILTGETDTAYKLWGSNWRMPTSEELANLCGLGAWDGTKKGMLFVSSDYAGNTVFLPAAGCYVEGDTPGRGNTGYYRSNTPNGRYNAYILHISSSEQQEILSRGWEICYSVRAVLEEAASPAPVGGSTTGTAEITGGTVVKWVQLWAGGPKFAEYNVGVTDGNAESCGGYYCWGGSKDKDPGSDYNDGTVELTGDNDTATKLWGSEWRMPTQAELQALLANCDVEVIEDLENAGKILGTKYTGKAEPYSSNSIFLPAAGYCYSGSLQLQDNNGFYWSSTHNGSSNAYDLAFGSGGQGVGNDCRYYGFSVRAVLNESAE